MPRGHRKRGAFDCTIWFDDGSRYQLTSNGERIQSNEEIAAAIRKNLLPVLEAAEKARQPRPTTALDPSRQPRMAVDDSPVAEHTCMNGDVTQPRGGGGCPACEQAEARRRNLEAR